MDAEDETEKTQDSETNATRRFFIMFIIGFCVTLAGIAILIFTALLYGESSVNFGGVIFVGPIPIVFGVGPEAPWMILIAIVLAVLSLVTLLIMRRETKRTDA